MNDSYFSYMGFRIPQWKTSVVISVFIHVLIVLAVFLVPAAKKTPEKPLITKLITPDEWMKEFPKAPVRMHPSTPSNTPPKRLYGAGQKPSRPQQAVPKPMKPVPQLPVYPLSRVPERTITSDTSGGTAADTGISAAKPDSATQQKGNAAGMPKGSSLPKSPGIPAPLPSLRERLFDPEVVGKIAKREETTHDSSITFDAGEFRYEGYMNKLKEKIESVWKYPHDAASRGIQGDLKIRFTIGRNGRLEDAEVLRTSGYRDLDEAAVQALKEGSPYWPLPDDWKKDSLTITGHFVYSLYGAFIR